MKEELSKLFGIEAKEKRFENVKGLPIYLVINRELNLMKIDNYEFLLVEIKDNEQIDIKKTKGTTIEV